MYSVFDEFLESDTWPARLPSDLRRFYQALYKVVWKEEFNAEAMKKYMKQRLHIAHDDCKSYHAKAMQRLCHDAWAVRDFLRWQQVPQPIEEISLQPVSLLRPYRRVGP